MSEVYRQYLDKIRSDENVEVIEQEVDKVYQIGRHLQIWDAKKIVEFKKVKDSVFPLLGNVCASREMLAISMGIKIKDIHTHLLEGLNSPIEPIVVDTAPFLENMDENPNLLKHPVPKFFEEDAGFYYSSGLIITKGLDTGVHNSSIHRQLIISQNETTARIVPRHLYHNIKVAESMDKDLPIAVAFGLHPAVILAASTPTNISIDEMHVANKMMAEKLTRVKLPNSGILVPTHAEVVYEGVILKNRREREGPFVDVTGTLDHIRDEPVLRIDRVYYRNSAHLTTILPSQTEHYTLMGLGREVTIRESVLNVVPEIGNVYLTTGGAGWLHAVVSFKKQSEGDGKNVIMAAFAGHGSLKWVTVVDLDINVYDPVEVEWATITRTGHDDIIVIPSARGSSLDPAMDVDRKVSIKVGIDATKSLYKSEASYKRIKIPDE
ncbi:MAG: UbiD family decarboxylase [Candidatus Heimdallarchaeota archaeon]|nr:UbiD family decarboxylase [Candidatus Heimdallarchaeota archaeon]